MHDVVRTTVIQVFINTASRFFAQGFGEGIRQIGFTRYMDLLPPSFFFQPFNNCTHPFVKTQ